MLQETADVVASIEAVAGLLGASRTAIEALVSEHPRYSPLQVLSSMHSRRVHELRLGCSSVHACRICWALAPSCACLVMTHGKITLNLTLRLTSGFWTARQWRRSWSRWHGMCQTWTRGRLCSAIPHGLLGWNGARQGARNSTTAGCAHSRGSRPEWQRFPLVHMLWLLHH